MQSLSMRGPPAEANYMVRGVFTPLQQEACSGEGGFRKHWQAWVIHEVESFW